MITSVMPPWALEAAAARWRRRAPSKETPRRNRRWLDVAACWLADRRRCGRRRTTQDPAVDATGCGCWSTKKRPNRRHEKTRGVWPRSRVDPCITIQTQQKKWLGGAGSQPPPSPITWPRSARRPRQYRGTGHPAGAGMSGRGHEVRWSWARARDADRASSRSLADDDDGHAAAALVWVRKMNSSGSTRRATRRSGTGRRPAVCTSSSWCSTTTDVGINHKRSDDAPARRPRVATSEHDSGRATCSRGARG